VIRDRFVRRGASGGPAFGGRDGVVQRVAAAAVLIGSITLLARAAGFGRWLAFSGSVGASCAGTAYATANLLPNVLFEIVAGGALAATVVPVVSAAAVRAGPDAADRVASAMLTWTVLLLTPFAVALALAAGPVAGWLLGRPDCPGQTDATARMLVVFAPQVVLYGVGVVLTGVLQARRRFLGPALAPLLSSGLVIGVYLLFGAVADPPADAPDWLPSRPEQALLAWGTTAGVAVLSLLLLGPARLAGIRLRPTLRLDPASAVRARRLAAAGLAALLAQQALVLVTARLANGSGAGALNVYQYAQAVYLLPYAVLAVPLATAAFPALSDAAAAGAGPQYARVLGRSTRLVLLVSVAGAALLTAVAPAIGALFVALDRAGPAVGPVGATITAYAPGLVGFGLIAHLGRALYAAGAAGRAGRAVVTGWLVALAVSAPLVGLLADRARDDQWATLVALGLASTLGMSVGGVLLLRQARRTTVGGHPVRSAFTGLGARAGRLLGWGAAAAALGRLISAQIVGAEGFAAGSPGTVTVDTLTAAGAGVVGSAVTITVLVGGLALTDIDDLRVLAGRRVRSDVGSQIEESE
jgi:putative peptidoglycan lipid II flippase